MSEQEKMDIQRNNFQEYLTKAKEKLVKLKIDLLKAQENENDYKVEIFQRRINEVLHKIDFYKSRLDFMRLSSEEDVLERSKAIKRFSKEIACIIPDGVPVLFHGNKELGIIHSIIKTGGLKTPDERGVGYSSYATQVDVTNKYDTHVSLEFAEPGSNSFMPYGAIFVFYPLEEENEKALKNSGSEVAGGVKGVNFNEDRFLGIITTNENKECISKWLMESGINNKFVVNHDEFIDMMKKQYLEPESNGVRL